MIVYYIIKPKSLLEKILKNIYMFSKIFHISVFLSYFYIFIPIYFYTSMTCPLLESLSETSQSDGIEQAK